MASSRHCKSLRKWTLYYSHKTCGLLCAALMLASAHLPSSMATILPRTSRPSGKAAAGFSTNPSARALSLTRASRSAASATKAPLLTDLMYPRTCSVQHRVHTAEELKT